MHLRTSVLLGSLLVLSGGGMNASTIALLSDLSDTVSISGSNRVSLLCAAPETCTITYQPPPGATLTAITPPQASAVAFSEPNSNIVSDSIFVTGVQPDGSVQFMFNSDFPDGTVVFCSGFPGGSCSGVETGSPQDLITIFYNLPGGGSGSDTIQFTSDVSEAVPEPSACVLMGLGLLTIGVRYWVKFGSN